MLEVDLINRNLLKFIKTNLLKLTIIKFVINLMSYKFCSHSVYLFCLGTRGNNQPRGVSANRGSRSGYRN